MERSFVGVDISLTGTGVCRISADGTVKKAVCIKTKAHKSFSEWFARIKYITEQVMSFIDEGSIVFVEGYAFGASGQVFNIAELSGYMKYQMYQGKCTAVIQVPPTSLKKFITGKGTAKKELILKEVYKLYHMDFTDNNISDAFSLARMAFELTQYLKDPVKNELSACKAHAVDGVVNANKGGDYELFSTSAIHDYIGRQF